MAAMSRHQPFSGGPSMGAFGHLERATRKYPESSHPPAGANPRWNG
jgi:hypothetical protein